MEMMTSSASTRGEDGEERWTSDGPQLSRTVEDRDLDPLQSLQRQKERSARDTSSYDCDSEDH